MISLIPKETFEAEREREKERERRREREREREREKVISPTSFKAQILFQQWKQKSDIPKRNMT